MVNRPSVHVAGGVKTVVSAGVSKFKTGVGRNDNDVGVGVRVKVVWLAIADAMIEAMYQQK